METYDKSKIVYGAKVMWSQIDSNRHLRHSAYADFAAQARIELLQSNNFDSGFFAQLNIGPVLFREELVYFREVKPEDTVQVSCELTKCRADGSRWSFRQFIFKNENTLSAQVNVDGAWIDITKRKLTALPETVVAAFLKLPKSSDFIIEPNQ